MQFKSEITSLLEFVKDLKPKTIMEIGTNNGGTLFLFSKISRNLISLDLPGGEFGGGYPVWKIILYKSFAERVTLFRGDSHRMETFQKVKSALNEKIDFLFIDGDHTYNGVKKDFEMYKQLVKEGGVIAFHDIVYSDFKPLEPKAEVNRFWNEIKERYEYKEFVEDWKQGWGGIGLIKMEKTKPKQGYGCGDRELTEEERELISSKT